MIAGKGRMRRQKLPHCLMTPSVRGGRDETVLWRAGGRSVYCHHGYTGEAGYEIALPNEKAADSGVRWWKRVLSHVAWARVTRASGSGHESLWSGDGRNYFSLAANMGWTIAWEPADRDFIGLKPWKCSVSMVQKNWLVW